MQRRRWTSEPPGPQLAELLPLAATPGVLVVGFDAAASGPALPWSLLEPWTRTRAVTVADIGATLAGAALEVALLADLVFLREGAVLDLPGAAEAPTAGLLWALGRAGRRALASGLLMPASLDPAAAADLGLAQGVLDAESALPLPGEASLTALTAARDLARAEMTGAAGLGLEHATFRFLFAAGDPEEGANAFLEKRPPRFVRADGDEPSQGE